MTRRTLVPMDDSDRARVALEHALTIHPDSEITVLHVVDPLGAAYGGGESPAVVDDEPDFFADVRELAADHDAAVETVVREGTAAESIIEYVSEAGIDAIVMGSEGRSGVSRVLLGSVAEAVTRQSSVPVTIVPGGDRGE